MNQQLSESPVIAVVAECTDGPTVEDPETVTRPGCSVAHEHRSADHRSDTAGYVRSIIDTKWTIIALLFGVSAAFGLPVLWASRAFSTGGKVILTIVVTIYTILLCWIGWELCTFIYNQFDSLFG